MARPDRSLRLLGDLADASARAHTRRAVALRVAEALAREVELRQFTIGWCEPDTRHAHAVQVDRTRRGLRAVEATIELEGSLAAASLLERAPKRSDASGRFEIALPLSTDSEPAFATLILERRTRLFLEDDFLEAMAKLLSVAVRHTTLIERVAQLSRRAHVESADLRRRLETYATPDTIVARSASMERVLERADLVAGHDTSVLLLGETGTGKELVARRIHRLSRRAREPFVQVNCGAIPESLVESGFFGHEKGAFTGAAARHLGRFERSHGGTLFLDEVGELPRSAQVKLLRVLQEGTLERLGGERPIKVDVRVIAATHRPLERMVAKHSFRADLFYRLNVFPIEIPPLRERPEDVPALVQHLLGTICARLGCRVPSVPPGVLAALVEHAWSGNVRELANLLERAVIVTKGDQLELGEWTSQASGPSRRRGVASAPAETLQRAIRRSIEQALEACAGRIYGTNGAAARLGLQPSTLQGKMQKLRIVRTRFVPS